MGKLFLLKAEQDGKELPIREDYDRVIWAGLSWRQARSARRICGRELR